jgi:hypothetical protein
MDLGLRSVDREIPVAISVHVLTTRVRVTSAPDRLVLPRVDLAIPVVAISVRVTSAPDRHVPLTADLAIPVVAISVRVTSAPDRHVLPMADLAIPAAISAPAALAPSTRVQGTLAPRVPVLALAAQNHFHRSAAPSDPGRVVPAFEARAQVVAVRAKAKLERA